MPDKRRLRHGPDIRQQISDTYDGTLNQLRLILKDLQGRPLFLGQKAEVAFYFTESGASDRIRFEPIEYEFLDLASETPHLILLRDGRGKFSYGRLDPTPDGMRAWRYDEHALVQAVTIRGVRTSLDKSFAIRAMFPIVNRIVVIAAQDT